MKWCNDVKIPQSFCLRESAGLSDSRLERCNGVKKRGGSDAVKNV